MCKDRQTGAVRAVSVLEAAAARLEIVGSSAAKDASEYFINQRGAHNILGNHETANRNCKTLQGFYTSTGHNRTGLRCRRGYNGSLGPIGPGRSYRHINEFTCILGMKMLHAAGRMRTIVQKLMEGDSLCGACGPGAPLGWP